MAIRFVCPVCWAVRDGVDDQFLGKLIKCHECHAMSVAQHTPEPNVAPAKVLRPASAVPVAAVPFTPPPSALPLPATAPLPPIQLASSPPPSPRPEPQPRVLLSTGGIPEHYEIVDLVFAHGNSTEGFLQGVAPLQAFQIVANLLGQTARQIGANAVIHIRLEFRVAGQGFLGPKQAYEVYGYGTAVKLLS